MLKKTNKIVDSFSANQLMQALNKLKTMSTAPTQFEISFNYEPAHRPSDFIQFSRNQQQKVHNHNHYFGQIQNNSHCRQNRRNSRSSRVTPSPLKEHTNNTQSRNSHFKSRSHSPYQRTEKSYSRISHFSKYNNSHKQNKKQTTTVQPSHPSSHQSKRILDQRERNGVNYIPIQHRAEDLLKEKERKIAKLKKQKEFTKIIQEKECTFKPQIKPYYKKNRPTERSQTFQAGSQRISDYQKQRFDQCFIDEDFICMPEQYKQQQYFQQTLHSHKPSEQLQKTKSNQRQYKNDKFNYLLDLIK